MVSSSRLSRARNVMAYLASFRVDWVPTIQFDPPISYRPDFESCTPLDPASVPTRAVQKSKQKTINDIVPVNAAWCVSETFRRLVEMLEPGVHQFLPIELIRFNGQKAEHDYFMFNILCRVEVLIVEKSNVVWRETYSERVPEVSGYKYLSLGPDPVQLVLSKRQLEGRHVWRGEKHFRSRVFFSDTLVEAIRTKKLQRLAFVPAAEE
jgi:hypothetical protein